MFFFIIGKIKIKKMRRNKTYFWLFRFRILVRLKNLKKENPNNFSGKIMSINLFIKLGTIFY